jgi:hypothetical protein
MHARAFFICQKSKLSNYYECFLFPSPSCNHFLGFPQSLYGDHCTNGDHCTVITFDEEKSISAPISHTHFVMPKLLHYWKANFAVHSQQIGRDVAENFLRQHTFIGKRHNFSLQSFWLAAFGSLNTSLPTISQAISQLCSSINAWAGATAAPASPHALRPDISS